MKSKILENLMTDAKKRQRILIVEDEPLIRKVVAMYVRGLGYEPVETDSGLSALAIAGSGQIDIILLDLGIPDIDGFEVLSRIKSDRNLRHIPVIITTVRDDKESIIRCLNLQADDYIIKPVDPVMLENRFRTILGRTTKGQERQPHFLVSLAKTGAGTQFLIAALLISVLPTLTIVYILFAPQFNFYMSENATKWALSMILLLVVAGYILLAKYPISIMRLRNYLALLAKGDFSQQIELGKDEDDLKAISIQYKKPLWIAEVGIPSRYGAQLKPWGWQGVDIHANPPDENLQALVLDIWLDALKGKWSYGVMLWNWSSDPYAGGSQDSGFTIQNKRAEQVIACHWINQCEQPNLH